MQYIKQFSEITIADIPQVGGKNASLGEMYRSLKPEGIQVPNGFATTSEAYWQYLKRNQLEDRIFSLLNNMDPEDIDQLQATGAAIRQMIMHATMPDDLRADIEAAYRALEQEYGECVDVAVRSSATAEDLPNASFAGQQETYLNIAGIDSLILTCKRVFASLFTNRAISYRAHQGFAHDAVALSIGVQIMVRADLGTSGVMFTLDTETGFDQVVFITSAYGLGENIVQGKVNPDEFYVHKPTLEKGFRPILKRQLGEKAIKMIYGRDSHTGMSTRNVRVKQEDRDRFSLSDDEVLQLARYAVAIEKHYSNNAGHQQAMDIEWAKDGKSGELFIVQARPETVHTIADKHTIKSYHLKEKGEQLATGKSIGSKIANGKARIILEAEHMHDLQAGEILITDITDPDWEPVMKRAGAIVTNRGGRTCHAAIIARELGIPAVVGCGDVTYKIANEQDITVSCAEGDTGYIYQGLLEYEVNEQEINLQKPASTRLMLNIGNPELAFSAAALPSDGVGLARLEFIINTTIGIHPNALLKSGSLPRDEQDQINRACSGYPDNRTFYIDKLAEGIGTIAAAFYPRPVIVRMSDFKSNEYASLIGGTHYEAEEENPMIGFRGASRYASPQFREAFALECMAMKQARETMGLDNIAVMVPFVRTVDEAKQTVSLMEDNGLVRGENGLKIYLMCEIPANALLADQFLEMFDGFSIGSNDLTQLTLGVDRDSGLIAGFDERNPAVLQLMQMAIDACHRQGKYIGICGQAPSDYPEITRWLVNAGISSISLNPDSLLKMMSVVVEIEQKQK